VTTPRPLLVDTDIASWLGWSPHEKGKPFLRFITGRLLALSFASVGELWAGAEIAEWGNPRRQGLERIIRQYVVLPSTDRVARSYGRIKSRFRGQCGEADMWVAATALAQDPTLEILTSNLRHFRPMAEAFGLTLVHPTIEAGEVS
jgi:predicted nucleic acid-binding protein